MVPLGSPGIKTLRIAVFQSAQRCSSDMAGTWDPWDQSLEPPTLSPTSLFANDLQLRERSLKLR